MRDLIISHHLEETLTANLKKVLTVTSFKGEISMNKIARLGMLSFLGVMLVFTGCASKKKTNRSISALESQVNVLTSELERVDQDLQETRAAVQPGGAASARYASGVSTSGSVYRTPSGFELPSADIQRALKNAGYYQGTIDGKIGGGTKDAIKAFQRDNGLDADGVCGRTTWTKLQTYLGAGK